MIRTIITTLMFVPFSLMAQHIVFDKDGTKVAELYENGIHMYVIRNKDTICRFENGMKAERWARFIYYDDYKETDSDAEEKKEI